MSVAEAPLEQVHQGPDAPRERKERSPARQDELYDENFLELAALAQSVN